MKFVWTIFSGLMLAVAGCEKPVPVTPAATNAPSVTNPTVHLPYAQTNLPVIKVYVGAHELLTECALSIQEMATGMMWRTNFDENAAMLFPFGRPHRAEFHMLNTLLPLSAAYTDPAGVILEIRDLKPLDTNSVRAATDQVQYVLEVNQGWFARHAVNTGAVVVTQFGPLSKTFTPQP